MIRTIIGAALLGIAGTAQAASPFDGTWVWDAAATELPAQPDVYLLADGSFRCESCPVPYAVPADGAYHPVVSKGQHDAVAIKVEGERVVRLSTRRASEPVGTTVFAVSPESGELRTEIADLSSGKPVVTTLISTRVEAGPAGSHRLSGAWRQVRIESASQEATTVNLRVSGQTIDFSDPTGFSYKARFDGRDYPVYGIGPGRTVVVRRIGRASFEETQKLDGKPVSIIVLTVASDRKSAHYVFQDLVEGVTSRGILHRRSATRTSAANREQI